VRPEYTEAARALGHHIAQEGWGLVYGGGKVGLMGTVADATLAAGGEVIGVIPESLMSREVGHTGLTALHVVSTMHQRKQQMAELADVFIALPGGIGTFEELFEVWTWRQLGYHAKPVGLVNVAGYYDGLLGFLDSAVDQGFVRPPQRDLLQVDADPCRLFDRLAAQLPPTELPDRLDRI
jgi:uncharacterized protein (TIGR00730 family)